ncbi:MAG: rhodanese-like domain-containing protein [Deltaproteobacteria bacterium]|nr:rhodanese-like domain-containing protein [Deltaproteobacteria bacterium]
MNKKMRALSCMVVILLTASFCVFCVSNTVNAKDLKDYLNEARAFVGSESIISPQAAAQMIKSNPAVIVIDVREPNEYSTGHIKGSILIPRGLLEFKIKKNDIYPDINKGRMPTLDTPIITICKMGGRCLLATQTLKEMGYKNVKTIKGGYKTWKAARLPLAR